MGGMMDDDQKLAEAVRAERLSGDKNFVYIRAEHRNMIGLRAALETEAAESGRMLVMEPGQLRPAGMVRAEGGETIERGDDRAFLKNLAGIARGDVGMR